MCTRAIVCVQSHGKLLGKTTEVKMKFEDLFEHDFFKEVMQDSVDTQHALGLKLTDDIDDFENIDELQFYVMRVGFSLSHAYTWVEQLHQAVHFMSNYNYSESKKAKEVRINRPAHLLYNVENYLIRLQSAYDRCLQLTNAVFHICISDELVAHSVLVSNLQISRTSIPKLLKTIRKVIDAHAQSRHQLVHRHSHMDPELRKIELLYMHSKETWPDDAKFSYERLVTFRAERIRSFTKKKKLEFEKINDALVLALGPFFDELHIQYKRQKLRITKLL